jgi:hypothetical protein
MMAVLLALFVIGPTNAREITLDQADQGVTAEVAFTWVDADRELFRFASYIRHSYDYTVEGIVTRWEAYDASGAIVGSQLTKHPPILAGMALPYVGGAGSIILSGVPASVALFVVDSGKRTDTLPRIFTVDGIDLRPDGTVRRPRLDEYRVAATVTTDDQPTASDAIAIQIIVKDGTGGIVGAEFDRPNNVPEILAPGSRIRIEDSSVHTVAPAAVAEVVAYVRPQ